MALCTGAYDSVEPTMTPHGERCICPKCGAEWGITRTVIPVHDDGKPSIWTRSTRRPR